MRETAATSLEFVGVAVAISLLVGGLTVGLRNDGRTLGNAVGGRIEQAVKGDARQAVATDGRWRTWSERRVAGGGDEKVHVPRDTLRLTPAVDPVAVWTREWKRDGMVAGVDAAVDARACMLCTALEWSRDARTGASTGSAGRHVGGEGSIQAEGRLALASVDATVRGSRRFGPLVTNAQGRVRSSIGAEAQLDATARLGRELQALEIEGGAMAGASARAEGRVGAALLGVAVEQSGRIEGWAGAGARGSAGVRREGGKVSWKFGWGAALGLGAAAEWSGAIDVTELPDRYRDLSRRSLAISLAIARSP